MNLSSWLDTAAVFAAPYASTWFQVMAQGMGVLTLSLIWCLLWRRAAAATRHLICLMAVLSLPLLLCVSLVPHFWSTPLLWSITTSLDSGNKVFFAINLVPLRATPNSPAASAAELEMNNPNAPANSKSGPSFATQFSRGWLGVAFLVWISGAILGMLSILFGHLKLGQWTRNAIVLNTSSNLPACEPSCHANSLIDWTFLLSEACQTLGLRHPPALLLAFENIMPLTWGWLQPKVLLPADATHWSLDKCRTVLLHELAHVKRRDCLAQFLAQTVCALFWLNPLAWFAARQMHIERERACDDLVLNAGCKPSDYATQLLDLARAFRRLRLAPGIAIARSTQLQGRIAAIIDTSRKRRLHPFTAIIIVLLMGVVIGCVTGISGEGAPEKIESSALREQQIDHLKSFAAAKVKQSQILASRAGEPISSEFQQFFDAALQGDYLTVTNRYEFYKRHHPQYVSEGNAIEGLHTPYWNPVLELCLAYDHVVLCEPKYTRLLYQEIFNSLPLGSIYFGGTDPGRGVPTAFAKSSIEGDPVFCLSQNPLADSSYLDYLHAMYGGKIYTPSSEDSKQCYQEYIADAERRLEDNKLKPGEVVKKVDGNVQVSGQVAVMSINALLAKVTFEKNPDRDFYIEESFPLDWMYPHLEPHGLLMRINRQQHPQLPDDLLVKDREYWHRLVTEVLGISLDDSTVPELAAFVQRVYVRKDLNGFKGDPLYVQNDYAKKIFSKLRCSIAGIYAWRLGPASPEFKPDNEADTERLVKQADLAFRQAFALCPYSPEAVFRYVNFLVQFKRYEDARLVAQTSLEVNQNPQVKDLLQNIEKITQQ